MLESLSPLLDAGVQLLAMVVLALPPVLVRACLAWLERRTAREVSAEQETRAAQLVEDAVHYAEESARKRLKAGEAVAGEPGFKMQKALAFASKEAERLGLRSLTEQGLEHLSDKIEARLGFIRADDRWLQDAKDKADAAKPTADRE